MLLAWQKTYIRNYEELKVAHCFLERQNWKQITKLKETFAKIFSKPLKSHILTISMRKKLLIAGHFRRLFCLTLHKRCRNLKKKYSYWKGQCNMKWSRNLEISNFQNTDPILAMVNSYDKHQSLERIKMSSCNSTFSFRKTNSKEVTKIIDHLNIKKACQSSDISTKIIKLNKDIVATFISDNFNSSIDKGEFPNDLKHADIAPVH